MFQARKQDASELFGIVGGQVVGRWVHVDYQQARQPVAQGGQAQHQRPQFALGGGQRAFGQVGLEQSVVALGYQATVGVGGPVIDDDGQVTSRSPVQPL